MFAGQFLRPGNDVTGGRDIFPTGHIRYGSRHLQAFNLYRLETGTIEQHGKNDHGHSQEK